MTFELAIEIAPHATEPRGALVLYAHENAELTGRAAEHWAKTGLDWAKVTTAAGFAGKQGQVLDLIAPAGLAVSRLLVLGAGKPADDTTPRTAHTDRGGSLAAKLQGARIEAASVVIEGLSADAVGEIAAGLRLRTYKFDKYKSAKKPEDNEGKRLSVVFLVDDPAAAGVAIASRHAVAEGTILARDLVNEPANVLGPVEFADRAAALDTLGVGIEVLTPDDMARLGMNSLLCVSAGSERPARLVIMTWNGGKSGDAPLAFVGKGVVFDTGGISIKPAASMEDMKGDMGGAAAVVGLMHALASRKAPVNAVGVIGVVENMPDGKATRPGDIVKAMSGTTIEVINTDAEGRLVLADALWYTQDRFKPKFMINLATLTGAIGVALGHEHAGLFSNNDELADRLLAAGLVSGEKLWRMPLGPAYDKIIESRFADIRNSAGRAGGSILAAQFLQRFVNNTPWAHLDIAGTAFGPPANEVNTSWATGYGVALLDRLVRDNYEQ